MPTRLTHPREYALQRDLDVYDFEEMFRRVHAQRKKKFTPTQISEGAEQLEKRMGAAFVPRQPGKWERGFLALPERFLDEDVTWGEYAVTAHESAHGRMFKQIPNRLLGPAKFVTTGDMATFGSVLSMFAGAKGATGRFLAKASVGITGLGVAGLLASETFANLMTARELRRQKAPASAYQMPLGSELIYIGRGMAHMGGVGFMMAAFSKNRLASVASAGIFAAGMGVSLLGRRMYDKVVGHHPGRMEKQIEKDIESDFTAGESWTHVKNALNMFSRYRRKALVSGALAATLATTPTSVALAKDIGIKSARATQIHTVSSSATRAQKWRDVVDTVVAMTDKNPAARKKAAQMIYETGVHESGFLKNVVQIGGGPARGITQVERGTARDIIQNYAKYRTGVMDVLSDVANVEKSKLLEMSGEELGSILENNQAFSAALTRYKYKRVPTPIPETMEERASYWAKNYWVGQVKGKTPAEIKAMRDKKAAQFIKHNVNFSSQAETVGLTNDVMHNKRTQHQVMDVIEKTKHLFKI